MTAESSRKPSTEPERTPVENARLLLPQLTPGQRAVVGALIAECVRLGHDLAMVRAALDATTDRELRSHAAARDQAGYDDEEPGT